MGIQGKTVLASLIMILLVVFFTFNAHAEKKPKYGGTLVQGVPGGLTSLDAHQARGGDSRRHVGQYNDYLLKLDRNQNLVPGLAESWELPDQTTVVLHLKKGVTFQDGTEFNAEAVKFNFDRISGRTEPKIISPGALTIGRWEVGIVDAYTVKIKLKRPDATALSNLPGWFCAMLSPTAVKKLGEKFIQQPVGLGPFVVKKYVPGSYLLYEKWDGYWKKDEAGNKLPYIDQQKVMIIPDATTKMAALRSGTIDVDQGIAVTQARQLKKDPKVEVHTIKGFIAHFIAFATLKPPLDNVWLRKAINYAIDRKEILVSVNQGEGSIATSFFSPISWAHDPTAKWYEYSPEKAKEALEKGGKPDGFTFTAAAYHPRVKLEAELIQAQLKRVGINMKFDYIDLGSYTSQYRQQALYNAGFAAYPMTGYDPGFLAMAFHFSKGPYSDPSRPTVYDKVIGKINSVYDREKRKQLFAELHQQIYDRAGEVYYFWDNSYSAHRTHVKNFTQQGDLFSACKEVWLDK